MYYDFEAYWRKRADESRRKQQVIEALLKHPYGIVPRPGYQPPVGAITPEWVWQEARRHRQHRRDCLRRLRQLETQAHP